MKKWILSLLLFTATVCHAEYGVYGHGNELCSDWLKDSQAEPPWGRIIKHAWVLGYVTAFNNMQELDKSPLQTTDGAKIAAFVDTYCQANPGKTIEDAALTLIGDLRK